MISRFTSLLSHVFMSDQAGFIPLGVGEKDRIINTQKEEIRFYFEHGISTL